MNNSVTLSKSSVTCDEVFQFLSHEKEKYVGKCTESRKRAIWKFLENIRLERVSCFVSSMMTSIKGK